MVVSMEFLLDNIERAAIDRDGENDDVGDGKDMEIECGSRGRLVAGCNGWDGF